jgi:hypothetical protein
MWAPEDDDLVAQQEGLVDVVRHEHDGLVEVALQADGLGLQFLADDRVDGAERLVHQQDVGVGGETAGDADALLLRRRAGAGSGRRERDRAHDVQQLERTLAPASSACRSVRNRGDVVDDAEVRKQSRVLQHVADAAAQLNGVRSRIGSPSIVISPLVGSMSRLIIRSSVVLPQPEEPTNTVVLWGQHEAEIVDAVPSAKRFVTERNSIAMRPPVRVESTQPHPPTSAGLACGVTVGYGGHMEAGSTTSS